MGALKLTYRSENPTLKVVWNSLKDKENSCTGAYGFGFQGQEKDDEVFGSTGTFNNFKFRGYDSRIGRFWSVDPLAKDYPHWTPYQFAGLTPMWAKELEGLEPAYTNNGVNVPASDRLFNGNPAYNSPEKSAFIMKQTAASIEYNNKFKPQSQGFIKQGKSEYQRAWENTTPQWTQDWIKTDPVIKSVAVGGAVVTGAALLPSLSSTISGAKKAYDGGQMLYMTIQGSEGAIGIGTGVGIGAVEHYFNAPQDMPSTGNPYIDAPRQLTNAALQLYDGIRKELNKEHNSETKTEELKKDVDEN